MDAGSDISNTRGYSTDQQLELENLSIRKQALLDRQRESMIVAFAVEESAISRHIEQAERRAEMRCKKYDAANPYWSTVDRLLEKQEIILQRMATFNTVDNNNAADVTMVSALIIHRLYFHNTTTYYNSH